MSHADVSSGYDSHRGHSTYDARRFSPQKQRTPVREDTTVTRELPQQSERGIPSSKAHTSVPQEAIKTAIGEIREVMTHYTNCADPTESVVRKERVRQHEAQGQLVESVVFMVKAALAQKEVEEQHSPTEEPAHTGRAPLSGRLGPLNRCRADEGTSTSVSPNENRTESPIACRLGSAALVESNDETGPCLSPAVAQKRKPGRPPGVRKIAASPAPKRSGLARKIKAPLPKPHMGRKKIIPGEERPSKVAKLRNGGRETSRGGIRQSDTPTSSENLPIASMMPPAARRRMNFWIPSNPAP